MTVPELFGWVEVFLKNMGVWDYIASTITIITVISLGAFALKMLRE